MISGKVIALFALAVSLVGLLLAVPTERRWQKLRRAALVAGDQELVPGANLSTVWTLSP